MEELKEDVKKYPDAYQYERAKRFGVYQNAIYCALKRIGVSYKKSLIHIKRDDKERLAYQEVLQGYEKDNISIVYLDECGFSEYMPRVRGYAKRGDRCICPSDYTNKRRTNVIGACLHNKMIALQSFKHTISSKEIKGFLEQLLSLFQKKTVFVMDNASFYKKKSIRLPSKLCKAFIYS